jgi:hypothetical protein
MVAILRDEASWLEIEFSTLASRRREKLYPRLTQAAGVLNFRAHAERNDRYDHP